MDIPAIIDLILKAAIAALGIGAIAGVILLILLLFCGEIASD